MREPLRAFLILCNLDCLRATRLLFRNERGESAGEWGGGGGGCCEREGRREAKLGRGKKRGLEPAPPPPLCLGDSLTSRPPSLPPWEEPAASATSGTWLGPGRGMREKKKRKRGVRGEEGTSFSRPRGVGFFSFFNSPRAQLRAPLRGPRQPLTHTTVTPTWVSSHPAPNGGQLGPPPSPSSPFSRPRSRPSSSQPGPRPLHPFPRPSPSPPTSPAPWPGRPPPSPPAA